MEERQISGYIMAVVGFVMILINALSYLLGWDLKSPAFTILGLVLIVTGARTAKKSSWIRG
jgi:membrane protein implicated in regulation of membrane protease activity